MAASIYLAAALALVSILQPCLCRPEETTDIQKTIQDFQASIEKSLEDAKKSLPKDGDGVIKAMKEQSEKAEKAMNDMKTKIEEAIKKNPQLSAAIADIKAKVDEAKAKIKSEMPEVDVNAQKMADAMKSAYESVGKEMEKINSEINKKGGIKDDLSSLLKNLVDSGQAFSKDLQTKMEDVVKQAKS